MLFRSVRIYLTGLREDAFLEIKEGYIDSGAAPAKPAEKPAETAAVPEKK